MKYRESGMPQESLWSSFFDVSQTLEIMNISKDTRVLIDIGCGYGTFLLPIANYINGIAVGIDIDAEMIKSCKEKAISKNIKKIELIQGDITDKAVLNFLEKYRQKIDYISLFNILHCEEPVELLKTIYNILNTDGKIGIIHWKYEETPRGPSMEIRPQPEKIIEWAIKAGFVVTQQVELLPYHYGIVFTKPRKEEF
ncbi:MAG: methyltransferase type 12 [Candidatus Melainabacteria bacterium GWA2_34_9]|nr:MAG: methyltransferase type 12 [Candidatus Melainabacteria bacterium GWA2_34_9]